MAGFHRFLDLMSSFDWKNQFLLVNFNNDLTSNQSFIEFLENKHKQLSFNKIEEQITKTQLKFQEKRSSLPSVYIVTPYDAVNKDSMWTWEKPNIQQLCRVVILARQSVSKLKHLINNFETNENFKVTYDYFYRIFNILNF